MSHAIDRRPWLILSRGEAMALLEASGCVPTSERSDVLKRARHQIWLQVRWIDGLVGSQEPNKAAASHRQDDE
ncbi:MAG TPA: hypothetical protein VFG86_09290 [Chloroflexota bacterium]|nr:hypothetical protein [Chloroflexota bacterium]